MSTPTTSLPPNAPMTNGTTTGSQSHSHGEADVSNHTNSTSKSITLKDVCAQLNAQVTAFLSSAPPDDVTRRTQEQTRIAMGVVERAVRDYSFEHVSLSYNGGKDCLVLLILYLAVLHSHFTGIREETTAGEKEEQTQTQQRQDFPTSIPSIYAKPPDPFPAVTSFVDYSSALYHLDLTHISTNPGPNKKQRSHSNPPLTLPPPKFDASQQQNGGHDLPAMKPIVSFRDAFALYLDKHPSVQAIFVGTRRTDPHGGHLTHFDATDHNWPAFMRVHPVIDWRLEEIWCFLRSPCLRDLRSGGPLIYCSMYDEGYTSLGGVNDTVRNPYLKYRDEETGAERYRPAYEMRRDDGERLGRE